MMLLYIYLYLFMRQRSRMGVSSVNRATICTIQYTQARKDSGAFFFLTRDSDAALSFPSNCSYYFFFSAKGGFKLKLTLYLKKVETYPHNDVNHDGSNAIVLGRRFLCPEEHDA